MEIWKDIVGFNGYEVSNLGRVRSFHKGGRILSPGLVSGYLQVNLYCGGKRNQMYVHRLVAETFIPNPESKSEVNHIDGNKSNNRVENLEWATPSENAQHAHDTGLLTFSQGEDHHNAKLTNEQAAQFVQPNCLTQAECPTTSATKFAIF